MRAIEVWIEAGAGLGSGFTDAEYEKAGAKLIGSAKEVWDNVDMMVKVKEPLPEEYQYFRRDLIALHLPASGCRQAAHRCHAGFRHEGLRLRDVN